MIIKMIKYAFLVHHMDFTQFLEDIQNLGVIDITKEKRSMNEEEKSLLDLLTRYNNAIRTLSRKRIEGDQLSDKNGIELVERYESIVKEMESLDSTIKKLRKEYQEQLPWGEFDTSSFDKLADKGLYLKFFTIASKRFGSDWLAKYPLEVVSEKGGFTYFVAVVREGETINLPANEVKLPQHSASELYTQLQASESRREELQQSYNELTLYIDHLTYHRNLLAESFDYKSVFNGAKREVEGTLMLLTGFVPEGSTEDLNKYLDSKGIVYFTEEAKAEDKPPIKLKNNTFAKLFEPVGELYVPPSYTELDLTAFFAPFFVMFFGLCMGDVGYGIVFILIGFLIRNKPKFAEFRPYILLMQWLGLGAVVMGMLSGGVFGTEMRNWAFLPQNMRDMFLDTDKMMIFAVGIGFVQIIFGLFIKAYNRAKQRGWQFGIAPIAWILILIGLGMLLAPNLAYIGKVLSLTGVGLLLIFSNPEAGIFGRIGHGLVELYDVTGFFGDLLSYIRLFALGISGSILGMVVNKIASLALGVDLYGVEYIIFGLILLIGHSANIALSSLGSFVHPLRLTFVEFYKNSGFEGGGRYYIPFARRTKTEKKN